MIKNAILFTLFVVLASSIYANTNTSELEKFNSAKSSVSFTENKGQISDQNYNPRPDVLFSGEANGLTFHIRKDGVSYQTSRVDSWKQQDENLPEGIREEGKTDSVPDQMTIYRTDINWLGFNRDYTIENGESNAGFNNYYLPSCPDGAMNVKSYTDVTFKNLYAGVDVRWYEKNGELEYDFIVAPNTDYTKISWEIKGADRISIGENGQLIIETPLGNIEEQAPVAFQGETMIETAWKIDGNKISFQLGSYNENEELIIDPVVRLWGTYYGGTSRFDQGNSCATDASGNVYLTGTTSSTTGIATTGAHRTTKGNANYTSGFLVKFNSNGSRQWGTYYGNYLWFESCAIDASGNVFLAGFTLFFSVSYNVTTTGAHQTIFGGRVDGILVKFNSSGVRQWGTYYGGTGHDYGQSCATDASGNIYLAGYTESTTGISTTGAYQTAHGGDFDAFLVKFNSSGVRQWGTYYGGTGDDNGQSCAIDASGNVYLAGATHSTNGISTTGAHQTTFGRGSGYNSSCGSDAFLVKFNSSGVRQWGTYYGGCGRGSNSATDANGNVYLAGDASSTTGISTTGAYQTTYGGTRDAFLVKFNSSGVRQWGTYYGGKGGDYGRSCATDASGNVYLAGDASSTNGIATTGVHQTTYGGGGNDAFLVKFNSSGVRQWGTYYGGSGDDYGKSCAIDACGKVYLVGYTQSTTGIASTGAHQATYGGGTEDAFLVKFNDFTFNRIRIYKAICQGDTFTTAGGRKVFSAGVYNDTLQSSICGDSVIQVTLTISNPRVNASVLKSVTCANSNDGSQIAIVSNGIAPYTYNWSNKDSLALVNGVGIGTYIVTVTDSIGCTALDTVIMTSNDRTKPTAISQNLNAYIGTNGIAAITAAQVNAGSYDNCTITMGLNKKSFNCSEIGSNSVTLTVTDGTGNFNTANAIVTVLDTVSPAAITQNLNVYLNANGFVSITTTQVNNGSSDNCAIDTMYLNKYNFTLSDIGSNIVALTVKDVGGNSDTSNAIVTVIKPLYKLLIIDTCTAFYTNAGEYIEQSGFYGDTLITQNGIESIRYELDVTITPIDLTVRISDTGFVSNEDSSLYQWLDCNNNYAPIPNANSVYYAPNQIGNYAVEIKRGVCIDTSFCYLTLSSVTSVERSSDIKVYPNPTSGKLTIDAKNFEGVEVYDTSGRLIIKSELRTIDLEEQAKGLYLLKVNANGTTQEFKVFKD